MTNNLKRLLADADALTIDARRIDQLGRELNEKRAEIIDGLCELGIRVTAARAMVAKIECTVTLPEGAEEDRVVRGVDVKLFVSNGDERFAVEQPSILSGTKSA